jgi:hypothetical protein
VLECEEPHYQHDFPVERSGDLDQSDPLPWEFLGKAHQIHAAVNNR